ncbi:unnamed protein product [Caenorhabditis bovis]|uniref:Uncharacterized protein n=1 Tax=Caenorhabditis bovis TaxID=2654633 RepID=A0A8S1ELF6_9PELO|nr:unnamed protein product [Caenorhabditis bovis]
MADNKDVIEDDKNKDEKNIKAGEEDDDLEDNDDLEYMLYHTKRIPLDSEPENSDESDSDSDETDSDSTINLLALVERLHYQSLTDIPSLTRVLFTIGPDVPLDEENRAHATLTWALPIEDTVRTT